MKVCFPVKSNEGLGSIPYNHFGTAPEFVICDLDSNDVKSIGNGDLGHKIAIGKSLTLSPSFPPLHTVRATFTAHGVPTIY